ncbi:MAG TPA: NADH-quinone oxidoreductase subunit L [Candidatus Polarisedimenticolaceae bacterium]|nr:NADH-quinone oxidoreductase subunit L [Candidatus Polarisedimenticolaceae bacterium]
MILGAVVLAGPLAALAAIGLLPPLRRSGLPAAIVSIAGIALSLAAAAVQAAPFLRDGASPAALDFVWAPLASAPAIRFGLLVDGLSASMAVLVSLVALLVQIYSLAYMAGEPRPSLGRYYAYHSLFAFAMLGLVLSHNLLQTYGFWELVGLGSYLLIGFWFERPAAARAAQKAFWTTRLGDVGFALGIVILWGASGTFTFSDLFAKAGDGSLAGLPLVLGLTGVYLGAMGKSAQVPFHIWLPDAMEGPTPVSALIHAATMVAAGVFLMVRIAPLLPHAPALTEAVFAIGVLTAFLAASMALVERDIKRILAFSTVSQLGFMMAAVGAGSASAAYFHLATHAFFKALLFLTAGSLIHAVHTNDIFKMGRLARTMPLTSICFAIGGLALAGIVPTSGFFSKDEILAAVLAGGHPVGFAILVGVAGMTAFYIARAFFVAILGSGQPEGHPHESPGTMTMPMLVLAGLALAGGALAPVVPRLTAATLGALPAETEGAPFFVPVLGTSAALVGLAVAWAGYVKKSFDVEALRRAAGPVTTLLERRYYIDDLFEAVYRRVYLGISAAVGWTDRYLVDGVVNAVTWGTWSLAGRLRVLQSGRVQDALYFVAGGLVLLAVLAWAR